MAELFDPSKTEAPTQHRRDQAREEGQVANSTDFSSSVVLLAGLAALAFTAHQCGGEMLDFVSNHLSRAGWNVELHPDQVTGIFSGLFSKFLGMLGFILALTFVTATAAGAMQVGFQLTPQLLAINWERLSPMRGWSRLMSVSGTVKGLVTLVKFVVVFAVAYVVFKLRARQIGGLQEMTLAATVAQAWRMVMHLALTVAGTLAILGLVDYVWQLWRLEQSLRMSRQEVKEEMKREEGDPQVKLRVRKLQREAATKRMILDVPKATVVVTNPTHLAVALRYDKGEGAAPKVIAKGADFVAAKIVAAARKHGVPVLERKPVAQALFKAVKVGQEIPIALYHVVAEVLAYVYKLRAG
ncbi:MAG TPA: flagellar biosynthesis protein FlhB [Gemmataceae bacterium]|nr:flagellar biosynthesis protein FlhB [Gemmataceae bacterium]